MKGASGGAPFRPRVPQPEAPATGSRSRGGGNTDGDDVVSVEPALHGTVRNNRINQHVADMSAYLRGLSVYSSQGSLPPLSPHSAQLVDWNQPARTMAARVDRLIVAAHLGLFSPATMSHKSVKY